MLPNPDRFPPSPMIRDGIESGEAETGRACEARTRIPFSFINDW